MLENTSFNNDYNEDFDKRGSIFNLTNGFEPSEFKEKSDSKGSKKQDFRDNARNSQVVLNFPKSDEDNNIVEVLEDLSMLDDQNSFIVYEKNKHEQRKNDKNKKPLDLSIIAATDAEMKRSTSFKRASILKDCSMTRENYSNILHMYECVKKKQEKPTKKLKSIIKRPGETFMISSKKKLENGENKLKKSSDNNIALSKNVEFEYCSEKKIPVPPPIPLKFVPVVIEEQNEGLDNSFLGEDDHDFIKNLHSMKMKNKPDNQIEICEDQQHQITGSCPNTNNPRNNNLNNGSIGISQIEKNQVLSAENQVNLNIVKSDNKSSTQNNDFTESDNEEKINQRKFHQFSFFTREPILSNNICKKSTDNNTPSLSNNNETNNINKKGKLDMISENEDAIVSTTENNSIKIEYSITNPIGMSFPAIKPNKNYIISIARGNIDYEHKISNYKSDNCNTDNDNGVNDLTGSLQLNLKKKDNLGSNTHGRNSNSKQKIDRFLTSNDNRTVSLGNNNENNECTSGFKGIKSSLHKERYLESKAHLKTNTIEIIPESPKARNAKQEDYHDYVVVHKQNKYGTKNIDLARKSQIHDAKEILYNHIADYNTLNNLKTSLKKSYGDNVKNKPQHPQYPQHQQKPSTNLNTVKEKINQVNKISNKTNGNQQEKGKQVSNANASTKPTKEINKQVGSKSTKQNSKEEKELENVNIETLKNEELIALINEIKLQNEIIEKKYIEKNKNLKAKIKEMDQQLKDKDERDKRKSQEIEDLKFRLQYIIKSLRYNAENSSSEMSLKVKASEKVLTNITDFEDGKKKSQNLIEDYNNLFGPFEDLENKFSFEANVAKYRSFMMIMEENGLDSSYFYVNKSQQIEEDFLDIPEKNSKYKEILNHFVGNLNGLNLSDKWNYELIFKAFPKLKILIDLLFRRLNYESNLRGRMEEKTLRFFVKNMKSIQQLDENENGKEIKTDVKQNISNLSSVRSDNGKDTSNDKEDWIS